MSQFGVDEQACLHSVYAPPVAETNWRLEQHTFHDRLRYFSFGRHALVSALQLAGIKNGDVVLLPGFICREVLSAIHAVGARVEYYPVDANLRLACDPSALPAAKAIVAVDYFGFAQDLAPFTQYCARSGAVLIEDNAHGLFSRDSDGHALGTRGDLGIFSLRKTLAAPNGAAVVVNNASLATALPSQIPFDDVTPDATFLGKRRLRKQVRLLGTRPARTATALIRMVRWMKTGHTIPPSAAESETQLPSVKAPSAILLDVMRNTDVDAEIARRRELYRLLPSLLDPVRYPPLFAALPPGTAPYGYPFVADAGRANEARALLTKHGLECLHWPALPDAIAATAPAHYRTVWMVSFLW